MRTSWGRWTHKGQETYDQFICGNKMTFKKIAEGFPADVLHHHNQECWSALNPPPEDGQIPWSVEKVIRHNKSELPSA